MMQTRLISAMLARNSGRKPALYQTICWALMGMLLLPVASLISSQPETVWIVAGAFLMSFSIFNALIGLQSNVWFAYIRWSVLFYIGLSLYYLIYVWMLSGFDWSEFINFKVVYLTLFASYFMILAVTVMIRTIATYLKIDHPEGRR